MKIEKSVGGYWNDNATFYSRGLQITVELNKEGLVPIRKPFMQISGQMEYSDFLADLKQTIQGVQFPKLEFSVEHKDHYDWDSSSDYEVSIEISGFRNPTESELYLYHQLEAEYKLQRQGEIVKKKEKKQ